MHPGAHNRACSYDSGVVRMAKKTPAGWFPDPEQPGQFRYWDGDQWTEHRAPMQAKAQQSAPPPPLPPHHQPGPAGSSPASEPGKKRNWFVRHKILSALLALIVVIAIASSAGGGGSDPGESDTATNDTSTQESSDAEATPSKEATPTKKEKPEPKTYGDGSYEVGKDIPIGTYRSSEDTTLCYWATLKGFSGELDDIIQNGNNSPAIVTLTRSVEGFDTRGCGDWEEVSETFPSTPGSAFEDGAFIVGKHIKPGRYRASGAGGDLCYWARLKHFKGGGLSGIIANGNSPGFVEIKPSDGGFQAYGCGDWTRR
jgi:hypothetical protein